MSVRNIIVVMFALLLMVSTASAQVPSFSAGAFGGMSIPVLQEDQTNGTEFGLRVRYPLISMIVAEANVSFAQWGDPDPYQWGDLPSETIDFGISGSKLTSYGLGITLGNAPGKLGFKPFAVLGGAMYKVKNDDTGYDESKVGFNAGLGFAVGVAPSLDIDVRGLGVVAPQGDGSKKALSVTLGINYNFGAGL